MRECKKGCQKAWATVKMKTSVFSLQYLSHFYMSTVKELSSEIYSIFVDYIVFEILVKNRMLLMLTIQDSEALIYILLRVSYKSRIQRTFYNKFILFSCDNIYSN